MKIYGTVVASALVLKLILFSTGVCRAQDAGTSAATMADPNGPKVMLRVSADGDYEWRIGNEPYRRITAAMGVQQVPTEPARQEITARRPNGKISFERMVTPAPGKPNLVHITMKTSPSAVPTNSETHPTAGGTHPTSSGTYPAPSGTYPTGGTLPNPYAGNPDMFVRVTPQIYPNYVRSSRIDQPKQAKAAGWKISVIAIPVTLTGNYYDIKVQMVMKGVGAAGSTVEVPDLLPGPMPNTYTAITDELGKEAVVCYTARAASQSAQRWTGTFTIQASSTPGMSAFVAAREPTLEKASDSPCGGLKAIKSSVSPPVESADVPETQNPKVNSGEANLALARGSQLYNARRYSESRPLLITACNVGDSKDACNSVGFMYQNNLGVTTDYAKAKEYYLKACNDDSSFSCTNLGTLYRDGLGVPRDDIQAEKLFEKGCDAGVPEGCHAAGRLYADHIGVAQDNARALEFFKKACDGEEAGGCGDEGLMYAKGLGVPKDLPFAASLFKKACEMGSRNGCFSLGMVYRGGGGVAPDAIKSKEYFSKACNMGDQESCGLAQ